MSVKAWRTVDGWMLDPELRKDCPELKFRHVLAIWGVICAFVLLLVIIGKVKKERNAGEEQQLAPQSQVEQP